MLLLLPLSLISIPALAQNMDFSGEWLPIMHEDQPERAGGPMLGDYLGFPINAAARERADTWEASIQTLPEWQCRPHSADYIKRGPSALRITKEVDPVTRQITAFHAEWLRSVDNLIYLDGRPHPPEYAQHTWGGFATAKWDGNIMTVNYTHLKEGYLRRNGLPRSDKATLTEHWMRHGDYMTIAVIMNDPVYLTEPVMRTTEYRLAPNGLVAPYPCSIVSEIDRPAGVIPSHMPGTNPYLHQYADAEEIPFEATRGGAETMYPDYISKLKTLSSAPAR
jgi:hypothetical protein